MKWKYAAAVLALAWTPVSYAQELKEGLRPAVGTESVASVGSNVFEKFRYMAVPAYSISQGVMAQIIFASVNIPAGAKLVKIPSKTALKACYVYSIEEMRSRLYRGCLMDDDGDGTFDRVAGNEVQGGKKLPQPVPYSPSELILTSSENNFKQVVIYLGYANNTLRLSYREFMNDMARPAFTEEYTFPIEPNFPQDVAFKDMKLTVTKIDGLGLHYKILP